MLEPCVGKLTRTVLRGLGGGDAPRLPDTSQGFLRRRVGPCGAGLARGLKFKSDVYVVYQSFTKALALRFQMLAKQGVIANFHH